jgi:fermentation-respiration switch protein FrsA (DUF1100 family)
LDGAGAIVFLHVHKYRLVYTPLIPSAESLYIIHSRLVRLASEEQRINTTMVATKHIESTSKELDASFKPSYRGKHGWPSLVIEAGLSESLVKLRRDAAWWLTNSDYFGLC